MSHTQNQKALKRVDQIEDQIKQLRARKQQALDLIKARKRKDENRAKYAIGGAFAKLADMKAVSEDVVLAIASEVSKRDTEVVRELLGLPAERQQSQERSEFD